MAERPRGKQKLQRDAAARDRGNQKTQSFQQSRPQTQTRPQTQSRPQTHGPSADAERQQMSSPR